MAYLSGKDCADVLVDSLDVAVSTNEVEITSEAVVARRRPLGQAYKTAYLTGQVDSELAIRGWMDGDTLVQLGDLTNDPKVISVLFGGNAHSQPFVGFKTAYITGAKVGMSEDDLDTYEPVLVTSDTVADVGYVVAPLAARTTAGNTDGDDAQRLAGASTSGTAYLHITALSLGGYTNLTVTVRHSTDGITWNVHTAFPAVTTVGAQTLALTGTINQYLSISWAYGGAGAGPSWTGFVGVKAN
jgi:hypothetical protein